MISISRTPICATSSAFRLMIDRTVSAATDGSWASHSIVTTASSSMSHRVGRRLEVTGSVGGRDRRLEVRPAIVGQGRVGSRGHPGSDLELAQSLAGNPGLRPARRPAAARSCRRARLGRWRVRRQEMGACAARATFRPGRDLYRVRERSLRCRRPSRGFPFLLSLQQTEYQICRHARQVGRSLPTGIACSASAADRASVSGYGRGRQVSGVLTRVLSRSTGQGRTHGSLGRA